MSFREIIKAVSIVTALVVSNNTTAQRTLNTTNQQWIHYYNQIEISSKWRLHFDVGSRWMDNERFSYIVRVGAGYQLSKALRVVAGVATARTFNYGELITIEYRPYQDLIYLNTEKKIQILHRFRVEERFFTRTINATPVSHDFNFRFRYQIALSIPIVTLSQSHLDRRIALGISDEIFFNAGPEIQYNVFDRNRFVVGPAFHFSKSLNVSLNYNFQLAKPNLPDTYDQDNILWFIVRHTINMTKTKKEKK